MCLRILSSADATTATTKYQRSRSWQHSCNIKLDIIYCIPYHAACIPTICTQEQQLDNTRNVFVQVGSHQSAHIFQNGRMDEGPFAMVIIDSVTSLFRVDYIGRGELSVRQQNLGQVLSKLMKLAEEFNVAVLYTNQGILWSFHPAISFLQLVVSPQIFIFSCREKCTWRLLHCVV